MNNDYEIISTILNNFGETPFNYKILLDNLQYIHNRYIQKEHLKKFCSNLIVWGYMERKKGGMYPFKMIKYIPPTIIPIIRFHQYNEKLRKEIIRLHETIYMRNKKISKIKSKYEKQQ